MIFKVYKKIHQAIFTQLRDKSLGVFLFLCSFQSIGQVLVIFDSFPKDVQLVQREESNKALVAITGKVYTENQTDVALIIYKNKSLFFYQKQKIQYASPPQQQTAAFSFTPTINAELSEYDFKFFSFRNRDSILVKEANEVVCGDNIIIYGQSNALANPNDELAKFSDEFRFGRTTFANFEKNEFNWVTSKKWNHWGSGLIGLEIQRQLIATYKIPIGIINGSEGNKSIDELSIRDEKNHDNPTTIYGRLLKRAKGLGVDKTIRVIVWRQGESEALDPFYKNDYDKKFEKFRKQLYEDYPSLKKIYTYQNNIYFGDNKLAGNLRDYQRKINEIYKDCEVISTVGTTTFDGLHYLMEGYQQNGQEVARLIAHDFMQSNDSLNIYSPNIQTAYFSAKGDSLILEFDKNQTMIFPQNLPKKNPNHPSVNAIDYIYLDGKSGVFESGSSSENYLILKLKTPVSAKNVTYFPENYTIDFLAVLPGINPIRNKKSVAALTFKDVPIGFSEKSFLTSLIGNFDKTTYQVNLQWSTIKYYNYSYTIEKAQNFPTSFYPIGTSKEGKFSDKSLIKGITYFYRIKLQKDTETFYSNTFIVRTEPTIQKYEVIADNLIVFPNPVFKPESINIIPLFETNIQQIEIYNIAGAKIFSSENASQYSNISTASFGAGTYFIRATLADNTKLIKKFVVQ